MPEMTEMEALQSAVLASQSSPAEEALDVEVDKLKALGFVVVYSLARYDYGEDKKTCFMSSAVVYPEGVTPDEEVLQLVTEYDTGEMWESLEPPEDVVRVLDALKAEGWLYIFGAAKRDDPEALMPVRGVYMLEGHASNDYAPPASHVLMDLTREIMVAWSNATHNDKLRWASA